MTTSQRPNNTPYIILVLLLLIAAAFVLYRINNPPVREDPWTQYLAVPAAFPLPEQPEVRELAVDFNAGEYERVSQAAPLLLAADTLSLRSEVLYLLGVSYLKTREAFPAIYQLEKIDAKHPLRASGDYFRAAAYFLSGNPGKARLILADIVSDPRHPENERADRLLTEIR